jgi:protein TonB
MQMSVGQLRSWLFVGMSAITLVAMPVVATAADSEGSYTEAVRAALNRGKRFPTGREVSLAQPSGRSDVEFVLNRRGKVTAAKITQSSNSMPLDTMARQLVRRARYPAFPADAWPGSPSHAFLVTYNFARTPTGVVEMGEPVEVKPK